MQYKYYKSLILISLISSFFLYGCSETRLVVHGAKKIVKIEQEEKEKIETSSLPKGVYKIGQPYKINGIEYIPKVEKNYSEIGIASWYGPNFNKKLTANGEIFNQEDISAAHKTLPLPSIVRVQNLKNERVLYVRVNDRGPFVGDRIIDLSKKSAELLDFKNTGTVKVKIDLIDTGPHLLEVKYKVNSYYINMPHSLNKNNNENTTKESIYIQLGAFVNEENANRLVTSISNILSKNLTIKTYPVIQGSTFYKVRVGPIEEKDKAEEIANKLLNLGYNIHFINKES